MEAIKILLY